MSHAYYLEKDFGPTYRKEVVDAGVLYLGREDFKECDCLVARGVSGMAIAPILAYLADKGLAVIRKQLKDNHSESLVESPVEVKKFIIVDDLISSGETIFSIIAAMKHAHPDAICLGVYCYNSRAQCYDTIERVEEVVREYQKQEPNQAKKILAFAKNAIDNGE